MLLLHSNWPVTGESVIRFETTAFSTLSLAQLLLELLDFFLALLLLFLRLFKPEMTHR